MQALRSRLQLHPNWGTLQTIALNTPKMSVESKTQINIWFEDWAKQSAKREKEKHTPKIANESQIMTHIDKNEYGKHMIKPTTKNAKEKW